MSTVDPIFAGRTSIVDYADQAGANKQVQVSNTNLHVDVRASALPSGSATATNQDTTNTRIGATDESAAATDTSTSGLNGLLKRIAQRLTSILGTQTDGTQKARLLDTDGNGITSVAAGSSRPLHVVLLDAAGALYGSLTKPFYTGAFFMRPSQHPNRTAKTGYLTHGTGSRVFTGGAVTAGKTLYVMALHIPIYNTSTSAPGDVRIRDGVGGAEKHPLSIQQAGLAAGLSTVPIASASYVYPEPLAFTTSVALDVITGTVTGSAMFIGYEE